MTAIDIAALPTAEKLKLMETLWESLSDQTGDELASPAWHEGKLKDAEQALAADKASFVDWGQAKEELRKRARP